MDIVCAEVGRKGESAPSNSPPESIADTQEKNEREREKGK